MVNVSIIRNGVNGPSYGVTNLLGTWRLHKYSDGVAALIHIMTTKQKVENRTINPEPKNKNIHEARPQAPTPHAKAPEERSVATFPRVQQTDHEPPLRSG